MRKPLKHGWMLWACLAVSACGGSGATAVAGTLNGHEPKISHAVALYVAGRDGTPAPPDILMSGRSDMCALLQKGQFVRNTDVMDIQVYSNKTPGNAPATTGVFPIVQIPNTASNPDLFATAVAGVTAASSNCLNSNYAGAAAGSVTLTELGDTARPTLGHFETTFEGGTLAGYFYAFPCLVSADAVGGNVTCAE